VVSWSLLTTHTTPAIALQLMRGSYNGQQRPLTSKKDTNIHSVCVRILFSGKTNNLVRKTKSGPEVLLKFLQGAREGNRVEKLMLLKLLFLVCRHGMW
jgi:hypothetical protein